jgi:FMN-binding domain
LIQIKTRTVEHSHLCRNRDADSRRTDGINRSTSQSRSWGRRVWKASTGGIFVLDHVVGKHLYIDYAVSIEGGRVRRVDILAYRESYGGEIRSPSWLAQFIGKTSASPMKVGSDIRNISGATLSSLHVTEGVKRILAAYGHLQ